MNANLRSEIRDLYMNGLIMTGMGFSDIEYQGGSGVIKDVEVGYRLPNDNGEYVLNLGDVPFEYYIDGDDLVVDTMGNLGLLFDGDADEYISDLPRNMQKSYKEPKSVPVGGWSDFFNDVIEYLWEDVMDEDEYSDRDYDESKSGNISVPYDIAKLISSIGYKVEDSGDTEIRVFVPNAGVITFDDFELFDDLRELSMGCRNQSEFDRLAKFYLRHKIANPNMSVDDVWDLD